MIHILIGILTLLMFSSVAFAQNEAATDSNLVTRITDLAFQVLTPIIVIVGTWLAHRLVKIIEKKTGFDIPDKQEALIDGWVEQGIGLAEEKSRQLIREKQKKLTGPEKLEVAGSFVLDLVESRGWHEWAERKLTNKIEAKLGVERVKSEDEASRAKTVAQ